MTAIAGAIAMADPQHDAAFDVTTEFDTDAVADEADETDMEEAEIPSNERDKRVDADARCDNAPEEGDAECDACLLAANDAIEEQRCGQVLAY